MCVNIHTGIIESYTRQCFVFGIPCNPADFNILYPFLPQRVCECVCVCMLWQLPLTEEGNEYNFDIVSACAAICDDDALFCSVSPVGGPINNSSWFCFLTRDKPLGTLVRKSKIIYKHRQYTHISVHRQRVRCKAYMYTRRVVIGNTCIRLPLARLPVLNTHILMPGTHVSSDRQNNATLHVFPQLRYIYTYKQSWKTPNRRSYSLTNVFFLYRRGVIHYTYKHKVQKKCKHQQHATHQYRHVVIISW